MTTTLSTKGQIIIPAAIRTQLRLKPGDDFVITTDAGRVVLRKIQPEPPTVKVERKQKGRGLRP